MKNTFRSFCVTTRNGDGEENIFTLINGEVGGGGKCGIIKKYDDKYGWEVC